MRKHLYVTALIGLLCLCAALGAGRALAAEEITYYINLDGYTLTQSRTEWTDISVLLDSEYPNVLNGELVLPSGWYVARGNVTVPERVRIDGAVHLILCDGAELTMQKGIHLTGMNTLSVYGQSGQSGKLSASAVVDNVNYLSTAAIGGNAGEAGSRLEIFGGEIYARSDSVGAAIGGGGMGGNYGGGTKAGEITVYYGKVTAVGTGGGPGIGCGAGCTSSGGYLYVVGGEVTAYSTYRYAGDGIGGNSVDDVGIYDVTIEGGTVTAYIACSSGSGRAFRADCLSLDNRLRAVTGQDAGSASPVGVSESSDGRAYACRAQYARVEACPHTVTARYVKTVTGHTPVCAHCRVTFDEQPHTFDSQGICTVCGLPDHVPVTLQPGGAASGQSATVIRADYGEYQLPACPFTPAAYMMFTGWQVGSDPELRQPGDTVTLPLEGGLTLTAMWQYVDLVVDGVTYTAWTQPKSLPAEPGTWYLVDEVCTTDVWTVPQGETVLNLNGYRIWRGAMSGNPTANGSVIKIPQGASLTVRDTVGGGRIHGGNATLGGGVYLAGTFRLEGGRIGADQVYHANKANDGAAVYIDQTGTMIMTGGAIDHNTTLQYGGGAITNYGTLTITGGSITDNTAKASGGAIWTKNGITISGGTISGNTASGDGAGVCIRGGQSTIAGATISGNTADGSNNGGGVSITGGSLTMSGVTLSGNNAGGSGGGLYTEVGVTLNDCVFTGNKANNGSGGGIYMPGGAAVNLSGGTFTGNTATQNGGGVHVSKTATLNISGLLQLTGNRRGSAADNVNLAEGALAHVTGDIAPSSQIGLSVSNISIGNNRTVTTGLSGRGSAGCFFSDDSSRATGASAAGEVLLGVPVTLTLQSGDDSSVTEAIVAAHSSVVALPACSFTPPNMVFLTWQIDGADYGVGDTVTLTAAKTAVALWQSEWADFQQRIGSAEYEAVLALTEDLNAQLAEGPLEIPEDKTLTIDLNGHSIDRGLTSETTYGNVITINGYLTLIDSVGGGAITGGYSSGGGGGIVNNGTLVMQAGPSITGNVAREGGGVYNTADALFIMNGGTISHNRSSRYNGGGVSNFGRMSLHDGAISFNTTAQHGGGIWSNKVVNVYGGLISDNAVSAQSSNGQGGGICLDGGVMHLFGGTITGNSAKYGGGISEYESRVDFLKIQGSPVVTGNTAGIRGDNIRLYSDYVISVSGELTEAALLGVTPDTAYKPGFEQPFVVTGGLPGKATLANFVCDAPGYTLALTANGEAALVEVYGSPDFTLPASVQSIEEQAFEGAAMTVADIPDGCESIGDHAFRNCPTLTQIRIPASVTSIGDGVFDGCGLVCVFGAAGSAAESCCAENDDLIFVACEP